MMKTLFKIICTCIVFLCSIYNTYSQDTIYLKSGSYINAKVEEIGLESIKYKESNNSNGPFYNIALYKVSKIVYANGKTDVFELQNIVDSLQSDKLIAVGGEIHYNPEIAEMEVVSKLKNVPDAYKYYTRGNEQYFTGNVLFCVSVMSGIGWIYSMRADKNNYFLEYGTFATFASGITCMIVGHYNVKKSARLYNNHITNKLSYNMLLSPSSLGFSMKF